MAHPQAFDTFRNHRRTRSYALGGTFQPLRQGKVFEHFVIVGLPTDYQSPEKLPGDGSYVTPAGVQPKILYQFPKDTADFTDQLPLFCFPEGIKIRSLTGHLDNLIPDDVGIATQTENSFIFLLQSGENLLYGVCVQQEELLSYTPSVFDDGEKHAPQTSTSDGLLSDLLKPLVNGFTGATTSESNTHVLAPRCYCFISRFPFFKTHYAVLYGLMARERRLMKDSIFMDDTCSSRLLLDYYDRPVPLMGESVTFTVDGEQQVMSIETGGEDLLVADWCLPVLFKTFNLNQILKIYASILLEKPVVVVCQNLGVLSAVILSFIPLLRPFVWQGPLITVLPAMMFEACLSSPVPTIVGVRSLPELCDSSEQTLIIDIDNSNVSTLKGELPPIPNSKKLYSDLREDFQAIRNRYKSQNSVASPLPVRACAVSPYSSTSKEVMTSRRLMATMRSYQAWLTGKIARNMRLAQRTFKSFDFSQVDCVETLVKTFVPEEMEFMRILFGTQQFMVYSDKLVGMLNSKETQKQHMLQRLEDDIKTEKHLIEMHKEVIEEHQKRLKESEERVKALEAHKNLLSSESIDKIKLEELQDSIITEEEIIHDEELIKLGALSS